MRPSPPITLDSCLNKFQEYNALPSDVVHGYASKTADSIACLKDLLLTTTNISESLSAYASTQWTDPKLVSLLRQGCQTAQILYTSETQSRHIISALRNRKGINYGESIPLVQAEVPEWCISQIQRWCELAGLQAFMDDSKAKDSPTLILGGKVLVVDIDFTIESVNPSRPRVTVARVKTSYAVTNSQPPSPALDTFLLNTFQAFCIEAQGPDDSRDPQKAAQLRENILAQLRYLVMLDHLTQGENSGGLKWFTALEEVNPVLEAFTAREAIAATHPMSQGPAPLDNVLRRGHALAIPYLIAPSTSFLVYVSPRFYLSTLRSIPQVMKNESTPFDIPLPFLRARLAANSQGATVATLLLTPVSVPSLPMTLPVSTFETRPTFALDPSGSGIDFTFPRLSDDLMLTDQGPSHYEWVLDFTDNGRSSGVILSQSRMREIELVLNPLGGMGMSSMNTMPTMRELSWVDLLLSPERTQSSDFYVATYDSPSQAHPTLKLRLTTPEEPGFRLQRVPVQTLKEVLGVLEIVREQCWLNEVLCGCDWEPESIESGANQDEGTPDVTLEAIMSGTYVPRQLPVNVYLPKPSNDTLFDPISVTSTQRPKIVMSSPERPPITGFVETSITFDESRQRGVAVEVRGAVGAAINPDQLEELSRRGGTFGIPGRIWQRSHIDSQ